MMSESVAPQDEPIVVAPWVPDETTLWKDLIRPVFISQLWAAEASPIFNDKCLMINGRGFGEVILVAHVVSVEFSPGGPEYHLEDGSGRIKASKTYINVIYNLNSPELEEHEKVQAKALQHTYVQVTGTPFRIGNWVKIYLKSVQPVQGYHDVMYHILSVIHTNMLIEKHIKPYEPNGPQLPMDEEIRENKVHLNDNDLPQDHLLLQPQEIHATLAAPATSDLQEIPHSYHPPSTSILPCAFIPKKHRPYATLNPLARSIIKYIKHQGVDRSHGVSVNEMGLSIQVSQKCTKTDFEHAVQMLLLEAYITSPLDDGHVIITPRH